MVTGTIRDELLTLPESGIDYITALTRREIIKLTDDENTCMCEGGSLREIWEELDRGITIGTLSFYGKKEDQLSPIPKYQKRLLKAVNAGINKKEKERLKVV